MEDKNMARVELNEQEWENVVGGAFNFRYNSKGKYICDVDGIGVFYALESAKRQICVYDIQNPGLSDQEKVDWALAQGYLWNP